MQISTVTHQIRNLLQPVEYHVSVLTARQFDDPQVMRALTVLPKQLELIQHVLQSISILNHPIELAKRPVEMCGCVRSVISRISTIEQAKCFRIEFNGQTEPVHVMLDEYWFQIAIEHLLRNAIEAAAEAQDKSIAVKTVFNQNDIQLSIIDHGPGIDPDVADELFEPFATTKGNAGAGFGLAIARKIIETHGGKISLSRSEAPAFTCASITLEKN